ncbi:MAG: FIST C-terminal domain-containing protein [Deltaproteobacteria bacterium]|nr:FIST C-terminal domain-containing protein [Deltaproteobacteria bacterium]
MKWHSTLSQEADLEKAMAESFQQIHTQLSEDPDLVVIFVSEHHAKKFDQAPVWLAKQFPKSLLIGCSAGGVIGGGKEIEGRPGFSLTAATLPNVELIPFRTESKHLPKSVTAPQEWEKALHTPEKKNPHFLLLADPFTFEAEYFLQGLDQTFPKAKKIGGLASGGRGPGANVLYLGDKIYPEGLVGMAMCGDIEIDTIVAQGCRPIGMPMFVTRFQKNVITELDGRPPAEVLQALFQSLGPSDQQLFRTSLFLGVVMKESQQEYHQGDFLIRNLVGMDPNTGALAVGTLLKDGMVVQFHLRDAKTSAQDLEELLSKYKNQLTAQPQGSLLFSCLGRGVHLYGKPDHDTNVFRQKLGDIPLGGFFCNGEIGPVQETTFLHGYTSSFGIFRPKKG